MTGVAPRTSVRIRVRRAVSVSPPAAVKTGFRISYLLSRISLFTPALKSLQNNSIAEQLKEYGANRMSFQSCKVASYGNRPQTSAQCPLIFSLAIPWSVVNKDNCFSDFKRVNAFGYFVKYLPKSSAFSDPKCVEKDNKCSGDMLAKQ